MGRYFKGPNLAKYWDLGKNLLSTCFYDDFSPYNLKRANLKTSTSKLLENCTVLTESVS